MKYHLWLIVLLLIPGHKAHPDIAYIIPDVGSPGMCVYIEMIAQYDDKGAFGSDGIYLNNPGDATRIELLNNADTSKVTFGPMVVSWEGRLISTVMFINDELAPGTSNWELLNSQFVILFRAVTDNKYSSIQRFYIVEPFKIGDISSSNETVFGEGNLGRRSPRGVMVVDSLILNNLTYTVSTRDTDQLLPGEQGYLPFTLLSPGPIRGGTNTTISVDAINLDGGPGGGGGGGRFCDNSFSGERGGHGYTAGGPGGVNAGFLSRRESPFEGSGGLYSSEFGGKSLNGLPGGYSTPSNYESAGGGSGHPFGESGDGCNSGSGCNPAGRYGAGSGVSNDKPGGSGGNGSAGTSTNGNNGGKATGNPMLVPLAGGSGGASGNPEDVSGCAGSGGGGGGAIRIYAKNVKDITLTAKGTPGKGSSSGMSDGGSGSGGSVVIQSRNEVADINVSLEGGTYKSNVGGWGRLRYDIPGNNISTNSPVTTVYKGIKTDTMTIVEGDTLAGDRGLLNLVAENVRIYLKPENGQWYRLDDSRIKYEDFRIWKAALEFSGSDTVFYLVAVSEVNNPVETGYTHEPGFILSPVATNKLILPNLPDINSVTSITDNLVRCLENDVFDTVRVYNPGKGPLVLDMDNAGFRNNTPGLIIQQPQGMTYVNTGDSIELVIQYLYQPGQTSKISDVLEIPHNVKNNKNPWTINLDFKIDSVEYFWRDVFFNVMLDTLVLDSVCINHVTSKEFAFYNASSIPINIDFVGTLNSTDFFAEARGKQQIMATEGEDSARVHVQFDASGVASGGIWGADLRISIDECFLSDTIPVTVKVLETKLKLDGDPDLGVAGISFPKSRNFRITNTGNTIATINELPQLNPPWEVLSSTPEVPVDLNPGEFIDVEINFAPTSEGDFSEPFELVTEHSLPSCPDTVKFNLLGTGSKPRIAVTDDSPDFGPHYYCEKEVQDSAKVYSTSSDNPFNITGISPIQGTHAANFNIAQSISLPYHVPTGDSATIYVKFLTDTSISGYGVKTAEFFLETTDPSAPVILFNLRGEIEAPNVKITPEPDFDLGDLTLNLPGELDIQLTNEGKLGRRLDFYSDNPEFQVVPPAVILAGGETKDITLRAILVNPGFRETTITAVFNECKDTIYWNASAKGFEGAKFEPDSLYFGQVLPCADKTDSVKVINSGNSELTIDEINIFGPGASLFYSRDTLAINPITILVADSIHLSFVFEPKDSPNGLKQAFAEVVYTVDDEQRRDTIKLTGYKETGFTIEPIPYDAGEVIIGTSGIGYIKLKTESLWDVRIVTGVLAVRQEFRTNPPAISNVNILKDDSIEIEIIFTPPAEQEYRDTLKLRLEIDGCQETIDVPLFGRGKEAAAVEIFMPDTTVTPDIDNFSMPVFARIVDGGDGEEITVYNVNMKFEWNATMFLPKSVTNGTITGNNINSNTRIVSVLMDSVKIKTEDTPMTEIIGATLLGNDKTTPLKIVNEDFSWEPRGAASDTSFIDGNLSVEICEEGGDRLLIYKDNIPGIVASPNPVTDKVQIEITAIESGVHELFISTTNGEMIKLREWKHTNAHNGVYELEDSLSEYASGLYFLIHRGPTRYRVIPIIIAK